MEAKSLSSTNKTHPKTKTQLIRDMANENKYYKTVLTIEVLSEEPIPSWMEPTQVLEEMNAGSFVGNASEASPSELTGKQMAKELTQFGSEPAFFSLDEDGNEALKS